MDLRQYIIEDIHIRDDFQRATKELYRSDQVVMKLGYPNGSDSKECLIIYALYSNKQALFLGDR